MTSPTDWILVIDDDPSILAGTSRLLQLEGLPPCRVAGSARAGLLQVDAPGLAAVLLDLGLPDLSGEAVLSELRQRKPEVPVVMVTASDNLDVAVRCMAGGAYDYIVKGSDPERLVSCLRRALESRRKAQEIAALSRSFLSPGLRRPEHFEPIITQNERMRNLFRFLEAVAGTDEPILLLGETGTGKELFARAIHDASGRAGPFVATNLGGLDDAIVSDTLFGHLKGSFTGADDTRKGLVVAAAGGTLFLDEIGEISPMAQVKLLRFLDYHEYFPVGSDVAKRSDARIVAATNCDLEQLAQEGKFRRDLLYRLSTYRVSIPPLRERREDLPLLVPHLLKSRGVSASITPQALALLAELPFPGNIRELRGVLLRASLESSVIDRAQLAEHLPGSVPDDLSDSDDFPTIRQATETLIQRAMDQSGGRQNQAARLLGITPQALSRRLKGKE